MVLTSLTQVRAKARLVDARSGTELWHGEAERHSNSQGANQGLVGMLVSAVVDQIINTSTDRAHTQIAPIVSGQLFCADQYGLYPGPYAPAPEKQAGAEK